MWIKVSYYTSIFINKMKRIFIILNSFFRIENICGLII